MSERPTCTFVAADALRAAFEQRRDTGPAQTNLRLPDGPWRLTDPPITCVVIIESEHDAEAALLAARRGAALVLTVADEVADADWVPRFVRDLDRLCLVDVGRAPAPDPRQLLTADQIQLIDLLAAGLSIPEAAGRLFLSLRTAERRVGAAKRLLGTATTAEAIMLVGRPA